MISVAKAVLKSQKKFTVFVTEMWFCTV